MHNITFVFTSKLGLHIILQADFLEKNDDALHGSLEALVHESKDPFIQNLFPVGAAQTKKKLAFESVSSKFKVSVFASLVFGFISAALIYFPLRGWLSQCGGGTGTCHILVMLPDGCRVMDIIFSYFTELWVWLWRTNSTSIGITGNHFPDFH